MKQSTLAIAKGKQRYALLQTFALAATTRPLDRNAIAQARQELLATLGPEVLVEASGVVGLYECFTKFVDATGKKANSTMVQSVMGFALGAQTWCHSFISWLYSK
jgi:hypothetical protein